MTPATIEEFASDRGALVARVNDRREVEEDVTVDVTFADPDEAVRERVDELGLSEAARGIDETVRASKVADSNVRDAVEGQVREHVEAGDLSAFESAADGPDTGDGSTAGDSGGTAASDSGGTTASDPGETTTDPAEVGTDGSGSAEDPEAGEDDPEAGEGRTEEEGEEPGDAGEDQSSMEEFL